MSGISFAAPILFGKVFINPFNQQPPLFAIIRMGDKITIKSIENHFQEFCKERAAAHPVIGFPEPAYLKVVRELYRELSAEINRLTEVQHRFSGLKQRLGGIAWLHLESFRDAYWASIESTK